MTHQITEAQAEQLLKFYNQHKGQDGGVMVVDNPKTYIEWYYTRSPGNITGRKVIIETRFPLFPSTLNDPATLADAVNTALDRYNNDNDEVIL